MYVTVHLGNVGFLWTHVHIPGSKYFGVGECPAVGHMRTSSGCRSRIWYNRHIDLNDLNVNGFRQ